MAAITNFILRSFQALFAIVVIGLSVTLIRGHHWGNLPVVLGFSAFVGGLSFLTAIVGLAAAWFSFLEGTVGLIIDGVVAVINIAGGIFMALKLNGVKCTIDLNDDSNLVKLANDMFTGGVRDGVAWIAWKYQGDVEKTKNALLGHCREAQADTVFMFLTAVVLLVSGVMLFLKAKKGY